ncbi:MAG: hypothetical protein OXL38_03430 [Gammaproteobacteria bacterium]|nr:hypothetical protein [Gammaproteobacteria bacterium]
MEYIVSYDLRQPGQYYVGLWAELNRLGAKRVLQSQWIVRQNMTAMQLLNHLRHFIDPNDLMLVNGFGNGDWASIAIEWPFRPS